MSEYLEGRSLRKDFASWLWNSTGQMNAMTVYRPNITGTISAIATYITPNLTQSAPAFPTQPSRDPISRFHLRSWLGACTFEAWEPNVMIYGVILMIIFWGVQPILKTILDHRLACQHMMQEYPVLGNAPARARARAPAKAVAVVAQAALGVLGSAIEHSITRSGAMYGRGVK